MSRSATSVFWWGIYLVILGGILVGLPNVLLGILGFPPTHEIWIRVSGVLLLVLAYYYLAAARTKNRDFFHWSVNARASVILFFTAFVLLGLAQPILILFGVIDLGGAAWTWWALRSNIQ